MVKLAINILKEKYIYTILEEPLFKTENLDKVEIFSTVSGGGLIGTSWSS